MKVPHLGGIPTAPQRGRAPVGYFEDRNNQRKFFDDFAAQRNFRNYEDWYNVAREEVLEANGGASVLSRHKHNLSQALMTLYPEQCWRKWRFKNLPSSYWKERANKLDFLSSLAKTLNLQKWTDWYRITSNDITAHGGAPLVRLHKGFVSGIITDAFPDQPWELWKFEKVESGFWNVRNNQLKFLASIQKELDIKHWEEWYQVKTHVFGDHGAGFMGQFSGSRAKALMTLLPDHPWEESKFYQKSEQDQGYWSNLTNQKRFLDQLGKELGIATLDDWHKIKYDDVIGRGGGSLIACYRGSLLDALKANYPDHDWRRPVFNNKKSQLQLFHAVRAIFPREDILVEAPLSSLIGRLDVAVDTWLELDVAIPALNLAFEYQGEQHYRITDLFGTIGLTQARDKKKKEICGLVNITLIEVPYWWDRQKNSLEEMVYERRPDLKHL